MDDDDRAPVILSLNYHQPKSSERLIRQTLTRSIRPVGNSDLRQRFVRSLAIGAAQIRTSSLGLGLDVASTEF